MPHTAFVILRSARGDSRGASRRTRGARAGSSWAGTQSMARRSDNRGSGSRPLAVRVRSARRRKPSSTEWLNRQLNDPYVAEAHRLGYRSRAAFKLIQLDERFHLLKPGMRVVDLGCAPGGWAQIAARRVGAQGRVVGIDLLPTDPIESATLLTGDFRDPD